MPRMRNVNVFVDVYLSTLLDHLCVLTRGAVEAMLTLHYGGGRLLLSLD